VTRVEPEARSAVWARGDWNDSDTKSEQSCNTSLRIVAHMEEAHAVLERLERIDAMRREAAGPTELLDEVRCLLHEAEAWVGVEGGKPARRAVAELREALTRERAPA
jgi:hypothetical protein